MSKLHLKIDSRVQAVFDKYPVDYEVKMLRLRQLIIDTAEEMPEISELEETLKWGEPSYITNIGSTIRIDWKIKKPDQYAIYFKCTSKLVPTFKLMFKNKFNFENSRAIVFGIDDIVPEAELKQCIQAGLRYHKVKQLPMLGI